VQLAAVRGLATFQDPRVTETLLKQIPTVTPAVREEMLTAILARPERTLALLDSIERDEMPAAMIGLGRKETLLASTNAQVRQQAQQVLSRSSDSRQAVFERYRDPVRERSGHADLNRGLEAFTQHCATCHRLNGVGNALGPHLETVRDWDVDRLLLNILDPNREVAPQSMSHAIVLGDGRLLAGLIADETASSLTLKRAGVADEVVLRAEIETLINTGQSFMPSGFDELISPADMADLIAYIRKSPQ
jgi:putative heme-binding domain-containing protein